MSRLLRFSAWLALIVLGLMGAQRAHSLPADFTLTNIMPTLNKGTSIVQVADGRLFLTELGGALKTYKDGAFYTLHTFPTSTARSEQGLFGLAADPNYATNGYLYAHYFVYVNGGNQDYHVIMRVTVSPPLGGNPQLVAGSQRLVYRLPNLPDGASRHNGGQLVFGADGMLWMPKGDGERQEQAENLQNVFGKLIRIDPHSTSASNDDVNGHYGIPAGNAGLPRPEVFAYGFRNPWSMARDPQTGDLYIGDVGGTEEINRVIPAQHAGKRFGWGPGGNSGMYNCGDAAFVCPMLSYGGGAITGVAVQRGTAANWPSAYRNAVYYSDHNGSWIRYTPIGQNNGQAFDDQDHQPLGLTFGAVDGNLYYARYNGAGGLWMIRYEGAGDAPPAITAHPQNTTVNSGRPATLSVAASGAALSYRWQYAPPGTTNFANLADNATFSGTGTASLTIQATEAQAGRYRCAVSNASGSVNSNHAELTVNPPNLSPVISFASPADNAFFTVPEPISFSATASDPEQGQLPASAFRWEVEMGHRTGTGANDYHTHPVTFYDGVKSGSFPSTVAGETSPQVWLLLILTVTDDAGNTDKDTLTLWPRLVTLRVESDPPGLEVVLMDPVRTDANVQAVIGNDGKINANTPQTLNGVRYDFDRWSFSGDVPPELNTATVFQNFHVPRNAATFKAHYRASAVTTLQAETATYAGPAFGNNYTGYNGTGFLDFQNATGDYVQWTVPAPTAGSYDLTFRYAQGSGNRPLKLTVNGVDVVASLAFGPTGSFNTWATVKSTQNLVAGNNTVRLTAIGSSGGNFDELTVAPAGPPPNPDPPPTGGNLFALRAVDNEYVALQADSKLIPNAATAGADATVFEIGANADATLYIKSRGNGQFCRVAAVDADVTCDVATVSGPEAKWTRHDQADGKTALRNILNNGHLVAEGGGTGALKANRAGISDWEKFTLVEQGPPNPTPSFAITLAVEAGQGTLTPASGSVTQVNQGANLSISAVAASGYVFAHWHASTGLTLADANSPSTQVTNVQQAGTVQAHFDALPPPDPQPGALFALRAVDNEYVALQADARLIPNSAAAGANATVFEIAGNGDGTVSIKSRGNSLYCRLAAADADVTCDAASAAGTEARWTRLDQADGKTAFRNSLSNGHLVAEGGGTGALKANRAGISDWEKFALVSQDNPPQPTTFAVTMSVEAGQGTLSPAAGSVTQVNQGASLAIAATPAAGYVFDHWHATAGLTLASSTSASTQVTNVQQAGTVSAHFVLAPPQGTGVTYQAEDAIFLGATLQKAHAGWRGAGYVDYTNASGDYIQWSVNAQAAGVHQLAFRYALQAGSRPLKLTVNGVDVVPSLGFASTGAWSNWATVTASVSLAAGANTVRLTAIGSSGGNYDELTVTPGAAAKRAAEVKLLVKDADWLGLRGGSHALSAGSLRIGLAGIVDDNAAVRLVLVGLDGREAAVYRGRPLGRSELAWELGPESGLRAGLYGWRLEINGLVPLTRSGRLLLLP